MGAHRSHHGTLFNLYKSTFFSLHEFDRVSNVQRLFLLCSFCLTTHHFLQQFNGKKLAATSTLGEEGVDCRQDVVMVHSRGTKRAASELDEEARLQEARDTQQTAAAAVESLEAVRDQIEAKREELSRPVFVSKKQRERLRKDAKKEASKASKTSHAELQKKREEAFEEAKKAGATLERQEQQQAKRARTEAKGKGGVQEPSELDQLKERYLRSKPATKKVVKVHELSKVPDTWDNTDDTSRVCQHHSTLLH